MSAQINTPKDSKQSSVEPVESSPFINVSVAIGDDAHVFYFALLSYKRCLQEQANVELVSQDYEEYLDTVGQIGTLEDHISDFFTSINNEARELLDKQRSFGEVIRADEKHRKRREGEVSELVKRFSNI